MKLITRTSIALLFLISLFHTGNAQESTFVRQPGYWTLGLNAGLAYQSSDVKSTLDGWGVGVTLAKNLYYQHGAPLAFDLRGRALYDQSYGLDHIRSYGILNNETLSDYLTEKGGPGYVYQNNKTHHGELALEGVLSFNELRERTNIILALYGGIGIDWYGTYADQKGADGNIYDYDALGINGSANRQSIKSTLLNNADGHYETKAQGFGSGGNVDFMPAVGIELGYQLTPRFSIGLGHKLTFTTNDDFDGQLWNDDNTGTNNNDLHHYTNLHLRWIIDSHKENVKPPVIEVRNPSYSPYTTTNPRGLIRANIKNINSAMDVEYKVNGQSLGFDFAKEIFNNRLTLRPGKNEIFIRATNEAGSDEETVVIYLDYDDPVITTPPPVVNNNRKPRTNFTNPASDAVTVYDERYDIEATVLNVRNRNDIHLSMDGYNINDFRFDSRNDRVTANVRLKEGNNNLKIRVSNNAGSDQDEACVVLKRHPNNMEPPLVNITSPYDNPHSTNNDRITIKATIQNVSDKLNVTYKVNNVIVRNFNFDGLNFSGTANLKDGKNTIKITARNSDGKDSDQTVIYYGDNSQSTIDPPTVDINRISQPSIDPFNPNQCKVTIKAIIENIEGENDIKYWLDGTRFYNFTFDKASKTLSSLITIDPGSHDVRIKATNTAGTDEDKAAVNSCTGTTAGDKPEVDITTPNRNNTTTSKNTTSIKADLNHVNSKNDISFLLNGRTFTNFNYNSSRGKLAATVTLSKGNNTIKITGTNQFGEDDDQVSINYKVIDLPKNPPVVDIIKPRNNSTTQNPTTNLEATVTNVNSKNDITLKVNGKLTGDFTFDSRSKKVRANIYLKTGKNTVVVTGTNKDGSDDDSVKVTYKKKEEPKNPPVVNITKPRNNSKIQNPTTDLEATVTNVNSKNDITLKVNGKLTGDFTFDSRSKKVRATIYLKTGKNTIVVTATNKDGSHNDSVKVNYTAPPPTPKPTVKITTPKNGSRFKKGSTQVKATIKNVTGNKSITFKVNGVKQTRFTFNAKRNLLTANINLKEGSNNISIEASNASGSASDQVTVAYAAAVKTPAKITTFAVSQPSVDPFDPNKAKCTVKATLENVTSKRQITLYLNNKKVSGFTYNAATRKVDALLNITSGSSAIRLVVSNKDGNDERSQTVSF